MSDRRPYRLGFSVFAFIASLSLVGVNGTAFGQSSSPAFFTGDYIGTNPQFNNFAGIRSFTVDMETGTLTPVGSYPTNDFPGAVALSPNGRYLAVGHESSLTNEDMLIFRVNADASLTPHAVTTVESAPFDIVWINNETLAVLETREGNSGVWTYHFDAAAPLPLRLSRIDDARTGSSSYDLAVHPSRRYLYVPETPLFGTASLHSFRIETDFMLTEIQDFSIASYALDTKITPNGRFMYIVTGAGAIEGIQAFSISGQSGFATPHPFSPFPTPDGPPSHLSITPDGRYLFVFHGAEENIRSFAISEDDGSLFDTGFTHNIGGNGIFESAEVFGDLLLVSRNNSGAGSPAGILVFRIFADGSFLQVGDLVTAGTRPYQFATWTPIPIIPGDVNADGDVNLLDIPAYVAVLLGSPLEPDHVTRADVNTDGTANGLDTQPFVDALLFVPSTGACCFEEIPCELIPADECAALGGTYAGDDQPCGVCPPIPPPVIDSSFGSGPPFCNNLPDFPYQFGAFGSNFSFFAEITLVQDGFPPLLPNSAMVFDEFTYFADFDLFGEQTGPYRLRVTNPDGQFAESPEVYVVTSGPPDCP